MRSYPGSPVIAQSNDISGRLAGRYSTTMVGTFGPEGTRALSSVLVVGPDNEWHIEFIVEKDNCSVTSYMSLATAIRSYESE